MRIRIRRGEKIRSRRRRSNIRREEKIREKVGEAVSGEERR